MYFFCFYRLGFVLSWFILGGEERGVDRYDIKLLHDVKCVKFKYKVEGEPFTFFTIQQYFNESFQNDFMRIFLFRDKRMWNSVSIPINYESYKRVSSVC